MRSAAPARGFVDRRDEFVSLKDELVDALREGYLRYGFPMWETSSVERLSALLGGGESEAVKQLFHVRSPDSGELDFGLRYDLTIPFARVAAGLVESGHPLPFRRAEVGVVYRADKPGPGRHRQFTQFDIDIVGSPAPWAELEVLAALHHSLGDGCGAVATSWGVPFDIKTRVNSRRLLDALLAELDIPDDETRLGVIRIIDKWDKISSDEFLLELTIGRKDAESGGDIPGLRLPESIAHGIRERVELLMIARKRQESLEVARELGESSAARSAIDELETFDQALDAIGLSDDHVCYDLSLARGLDYYTGLVFEVTVAQEDGGPSIAGGGRYDDLLARFSSEAVSGTGVSIGVDRIVSYLLERGTDRSAGSRTKAVLLGLPDVSPISLQTIAADIRRLGADLEVHIPSAGTTLGKQLRYANKREYDYALIIGETELSTGQVSVKDLRSDSRVDDTDLDRATYVAAGTRTQQTMPIDAAVQVLTGRS